MSGAIFVNGEARPRDKGRAYLFAFALLLLGYACIGRSFAELGFRTIFVGEVFLFWGLLVLLLTREWGGVFRAAPMKWLAFFLLWGLLNTVPYIGAYKLNALRDAVIWGYGIFALIVAGVVSVSPDRLRCLLDWYRRFGGFFPFVIFCVLVALNFFSSFLPLTPWSSERIPIVLVRSGEAMVHLMAILVLGLVGLRRVGGTLWHLAVVGSVFLAFVGSRASIMVVLVTLAVVWALAWRPRGIGRFFLIAVFAALALLAFDLNFGTTGTGRTFSLNQIFSNFVSIFFVEREAGLALTTLWRLTWWERIIDDTIFGAHFLTGRGFGVNLSQVAGMSYLVEATTRSPHSIHFTLLARTGVIGLFIWIGLQISWFLHVLRYYRAAKSRGHRTWTALFVFLIAYWLGMLANASFDVYVEGPMGGIWFWTIFGLGVAAAKLYERFPDLFDPEDEAMAPVFEQTGAR